jgi:hypothetical protein
MNKVEAAKIILSQGGGCVVPKMVYCSSCPIEVRCSRGQIYSIENKIDVMKEYLASVIKDSLNETR